MSKKLWTFSGSEYGISGVCMSGRVPGMLATCSVDKTVAIWDCHSKHSVEPVQVISKEMGGGKLYNVGFYPSSDWLIATGGTGGQLCLWEMGEEESIVKTFGDRRKVEGGGEGEGRGEEGGVADDVDVDVEATATEAATATTTTTTTTKSTTQQKKKGKRKGHKK